MTDQTHCLISAKAALTEWISLPNGSPCPATLVAWASDRMALYAAAATAMGYGWDRESMRLWLLMDLDLDDNKVGPEIVDDILREATWPEGDVR